MERYLLENFDVRPEHLSAEVLERWRNQCGIIKNPKRRFRFTANPSKRYKVDAMPQGTQDLRSESELQGLRCSESELQCWSFESELQSRSESKSQVLRWSESELQGLRWSESESQGWWFESESPGLRSKYESQGRRFLSVFFLVMEAISVVLDVYGKSNKNFLPGIWT
ncbi:uncharacterized protein LOC123208066 [Mangifera indica]|uniref:uncharacterized protein LOC123197769 n=1 Tax=Mangifera indica TaxID=29780 RepID=UPI001CF94E01|nr:uncharacterized protein LOC123197769 [Mangifera indica]XP_044481457.1 uncharacterized protein LOC123208066 [Mangifera indica]